METLRFAVDKAWERQLVGSYAMFPAGISPLWLKGLPPLVNAPWWKAPNYLAVIGFVASSTVAFALYYRMRHAQNLLWQRFALAGAVSGVIPGVVFFLASFGHSPYRLRSAMIAITGIVLAVLMSQLTRHAFLHTMREHALEESTLNTSLERTRER